MRFLNARTVRRNGPVARYSSDVRRFMCTLSCTNPEKEDRPRRLVLKRSKKEGDECTVDENHGKGSGGVRRRAGSFHAEALQFFLEGSALQKN